MSQNEKKIAMRVHANEMGRVLAAADAEHVGKVLKEGKISFQVSKLFYHEELVTEEELKDALDEAENVNLVGEKAVKAAIEKGLIGENNLRRIAGIPHAQIYKL